MNNKSVVSLCLLTLALLLPSISMAQASKPVEAQVSSETAAIQALVTEIRQLRLSLERSSFLTMRFQGALQKNQLHNDHLKELSHQLNLVKGELAGIRTEQDSTIEAVKDIERNLNNQDAKTRKDAEETVRGLKAKLESLVGSESEIRSRESTLLAEIQRENAQMEDWNRWLQQFEQYLQSVK